ncbi:MAG: hypothetical protein MJZ84_08430 [Paludibacteraceae bacterium]|nr:hypothetical protein [Paludibacteraceae bacterium]
MSVYRNYEHIKKNVEHINDDIKNVGYDYRNTIMQINSGEYLINNKKILVFMKYFLNPYICNLISRVKFIRNYYNFAVPKDYENIN